MNKIIEKIKHALIEDPYTTVAGLVVLLCSNLALIDQLADYRGIFLCISGIAGGVMGVFAGDAKQDG